MADPYKVVRDFESALCEYTGAPYCVTTTSCTTALLLACLWQKQLHWKRAMLRAEEGDFRPTGLPTVTIPSRTYCGVPMSIIHAGFDVRFEDVNWEGAYQLDPFPVWDSARHFYAGMWMDYAEAMVCCSFHPTKHLGLSGFGGCILLDDPEADKWLRMARFDGREEGVEPKTQKHWVLGYHANMSPLTASEGLLRLSTLPGHNEPLPNSDYPDLSKLEIFK